MFFILIKTYNMKNLLLYFIIVLAAIGCNSSKEKPDMPGAYLMQSQTINDGKKDTKFTTLQQLKIYTDSRSLSKV